MRPVSRPRGRTRSVSRRRGRRGGTWRATSSSRSRASRSSVGKGAPVNLRYPRRPVYSPKELAEYAAFRSAVAALRALPLPTAQAIAARGARALFARGGKRVDYVLANLRI